MFRVLLLSFVALSLSGCMTIPLSERMQAYEIKEIDQKKLTSKAGVIQDVQMDRSFILFKFQNTSNKTAKILWDESSLVMPNGSTARVIPLGKKFSEVGTTTPPELVPSGAIASTGVARQDAASYSSPVVTAYGPIGGGWDAGEIIECGSNAALATEECKGSNHDGASLKLLLTVEQDGKKYEHEISGKLGKSSSYLNWLEGRKQKAAASARATNPNAPREPSSQR